MDAQEFVTAYTAEERKRNLAFRDLVKAYLDGYAEEYTGLSYWPEKLFKAELNNHAVVFARANVDAYLQSKLSQPTEE